MLYFLSRTILHERCIVAVSSTQNLFLLQKRPFSLLTSKPISAKANGHSLVVSFLINSCGLSAKSALSVSERQNLKTLENPNLVLKCFKEYGFSLPQISRIVEKCPQLLLYRPEKSLVPKFEFLRAIGFSSSDIPILMYTCPRVLRTGLEKKIGPNFNCLEELLKSKDKAIVAVRRIPFILCHNIEGTIAILRDHGVPDANIATFIQRWPHLSMSTADKFNQTVELVKQMGVSPSKSQFVIAIVAVRANRKALWEKKVNLYKSWGCSEEQIIAAFVKFPWCMISSENKISSTMDFFVNKMGWEAKDVIQRPILFGVSLERKILPRAPVIQFLLSKGLLEQKVSRLAWMFSCPEKLFIQRCLTGHKDEPQLLKLYKDNLDSYKVTEG